ncbi:MAG TPA: OB-fold nucleic acid binding domain-containing protein [Candidatus Nanoarchaeia archaeon]|nr:OB-fold nucleic acid binding domain-containing protein [Candidatus Nanoarchaeia archaeon]
MNINEIQPRMGNIELTATVVEKADVRTFEKFGKQGRVCNATLQDDTGKVSLTLWNDDVDKVNTGDTVKITNGWANEYQGEVQLSTGKFGTLEVQKGAKAETKSEKKVKKKESSLPDDEAPMKDEEKVDWD